MRSNFHSFLCASPFTHHSPLKTLCGLSHRTRQVVLCSKLSLIKVLVRSCSTVPQKLNLTSQPSYTYFEFDFTKVRQTVPHSAARRTNIRTHMFAHTHTNEHFTRAQVSGQSKRSNGLSSLRTCRIRVTQKSMNRERFSIYLD